MSRVSHRWYRTLAAVLAFSLLVSTVVWGAGAKKVKGELPPVPTVGPDGRPIITEEQEAIRYAAAWREMTEHIAANNEAGVPTAVPEDEVVTVSYAYEGARRIHGPYFGYGSNWIYNEEKSGALKAVWDVGLKVVGRFWRTVGSMISWASSVYGYSTNLELPARGASFHMYSYHYRDGQYYKGGYWYTGVRVERRDTWAKGYVGWYDAGGKPQAEFLPSEFITSEASCHFYDDSWIDGMTRHASNGTFSFIGEGWTSCSMFTP